MRTLILIFILLTQLFSDQNTSSALGAQQKTAQCPIKHFRQKDGSSFKGIIRGEEYFNYIELEEGYTVLYNPKNEQYEYARVKKGKLYPSGIPVQEGKPPKTIVKIPPQTLKALEADAYKKHF